MVFGGNHSFGCLRINSHVFVSRNILIGTSTLLVILLAFIFHPLYVKPNAMKVGATSGTATPSTTSLALTTESNTANIELSLNSANGTFASSSTNTSATFTVSTNNHSGYTLSISADDDTGKLVHTTNEDYYMDSISSTTSKTDFSADTTSAATNYNGKWGILPSTYVANNTTITNTGANPVFLPAPTTTPITLSKTSAANSIDNNAQDADTYTLGLGARASMSTVAGTYEKDINLIALANPITYTITFNKNTEDEVSNMLANMNDVTNSTTITLPSTVPTRDSYVFIGWCSTTTTNTNDVDSCSGVTYNPDGEGTDLAFGIDQTTANITTLYAMWEKKIYIQDVSDLTCPATRMRVYDKRDDKRYYIQKITTGSITLCWMATNLDIAGGTKLYSETSNVPEGYPESGGTEYYQLPESSTSGFNNASIANVYNSGSTTCGNNSPCYSYYSFTAATAGTNPSSGNAAYDICPKGWRLPTNNEYAALTGAFATGATLTAAPWYGVYSGYYNISSFYTGGSRGRYWSSTVIDSSNAHDVFFHNTAASTDHVNKLRGDSVRCIAKPTTMQGASEAQLSRLMPNTGDTATLYDTRDGEAYTIAKLKDGNYWLVENLRLGGTTEILLTPDDTNIVDNYTLPASIESMFTGYDDKININSKNNLVSYGSGTGKVGTYYNYCAASAGTICTDQDIGKSTYDICPKGWRLPTSWENGEYMKLYHSYDSDEEFRDQFRAVLSGRYYSDSYGTTQGEIGRFWSSSHDTPYTYAMDILGVTTGSIFYTEDANYMGISVRCIFEKSSISTISSMQDFDRLTPIALEKVLSSMATGEQYQKTDVRDNKTYTIAKLPNNTVWMTTNLDLAGGIKLFSETSNVPEGYSSRTGAYYYQLPTSSASGFNNDAGEYVYNSGNTECGTGTPCYSYYSYAAATAGTNPSEGDAVYDICPKGWRLPIKDEFDNVQASYGGGTWYTSSPWYGVYAGNKHDNSFMQSYEPENPNNTIVADYWNSTADGTTAYRFSYANNGAHNNLPDPKAYGYSIRCVLNISMQDVDNYTLDTILPSVGSTYVLSDARDGEKYIVGKLADNRYWLLENLRLDLSKTSMLTTTDTNLKINNWTIPTTLTDSGYTFTDPLSNAHFKNTTGSYGAGDTKLGTFYNYCAASAGTYCMADGAGSGDANQDICPKGWRMPIGGSSSEYQTLYDSYSGDYTAYRNALRAALSGVGNDGSASIGQLNKHGYHWTSSFDTTSRMGYMHVNASGVDIHLGQHGDSRVYALSVRCIVNQ